MDAVRRKQITTQLLRLNAQTKPAELFPAHNQAAAELVTTDPFAFLIGASINRGGAAENAWTIPIELQTALGHLDPSRIAAMSLEELTSTMDSLIAKARYPFDAVKTIKALAIMVYQEFAGQAERLWVNKPAAEVNAKLQEIHGIGYGLASMTTLLIERAFPEIHFADFDRPEMDIKPDISAKRVLYRMGFIPTEKDSEETERAAIAAVRSMNPSWPGELDAPLWLIARRWCKKKIPNCAGCPMRAVCPQGENMETTASKLVWKTIKVRLGDLVDWEQNPVQLTRKEAEDIETSIDRYGLVMPLVANAPLKDGRRRLIDGHQRKTVLIAARKAGPGTMLDVRVPNRQLTDKECDELSIRLRKNTGSWDMDKLANFFDTTDLLAWGFTKHELVGMDIDPSDTESPEPKLDQINELIKKWGVKKGDLWQAGTHRILCGDSERKENYERLLDGEKVALINTDPPYGIDYDPGDKHQKIANDNLTGDQQVAFLVSVFKQLTKVALPDAAWYIWHSFRARDEFLLAMKRCAIIEHTTIIWTKPSATLGHGDYQQQYECCFYAAKENDRPHWYGGRNETTVWTVAATADGVKAHTIGGGLLISDGDGHQIFLKSRAPSGKKLRSIRIAPGETAQIGTDAETSDVWTVGRDYRPLHPTQKPVELATRALHNSTLQGDVVLDPFGGAGFTAVGYELMKRQARIIEQDPRYVAVVLERLADMNLKPELVK